jgi:hypothetical protein
MQSPPRSLSHDLQGASRITGGFARGRAYGNVFNFADEPNMFHDQPVRQNMGKVLLYMSMGNPDSMKPIMSLKHEVSLTLGPVLTKLAKRYTQIDSMFFF